jgi:S-methylmethionine-dependent homocysteine/selenocysteine methylase
MFREQAKWAKEGGVDFIVAETISSYEEASLALQAIKETGLPAVVNLTCFIDGKTRDGVSIEDTFT